MSAETLLTAARRLVRFLDVNNLQDGGLITNDTLRAHEELRKQVEQEMERQKKDAAQPESGRVG